MKVVVTGNKANFLTVNDGMADMDLKQLSMADNYEDVSFDGVSNVVINRDHYGNFRIIQVTGFTEKRGKFTHNYKSHINKKGARYEY